VLRRVGGLRRVGDLGFGFGILCAHSKIASNCPAYSIVILSEAKELENP